MAAPEELDWLKTALQEIDRLLRDLADFRAYPELLNRDDALLESFLEHIVTNIRDARLFAPPANIEQIYMANPTGMREVVLVADHNASTLTEIETILTDEDYRVITVRDAFEAISIYARLWAAIDLVVLDFSMPGMNGDLIFDELQAINPRVAAVVSGGFTDPAKLNQMLGQGLKGYLPKPAEKEKFLRQIQQVLAHRPHASGGAKS